MRTFPQIALAVPILPCEDVEAMIAFYVDRLGFERDWVWGEPPTDGGVRWGDVQIYFMQNPRLARAARDREIMLYVEDVDALHKMHARRGAIVTEPLRDEPWGLREYSILDPHGHRLRFAESLELIRSRALAALAGRPLEERA